MYYIYVIYKSGKHTFICLSCTRTPDTSQDWLQHFYAFDFDESPAGESFSLPAPSIKKDSTATSVSSPVFISTPSSDAKDTYLDESAQPRLFGERESSVM